MQVLCYYIHVNLRAALNIQATVNLRICGGPWVDSCALDYLGLHIKQCIWARRLSSIPSHSQKQQLRRDHPNMGYYMADPHLN